MTRKRKGLQGLLALIMTFSLLGASLGSARAKNDEPPKADPRLLQMAEENPEATFMVIVQKDAKNQDLKGMEVEDEVLKNGGQVTKKLDMVYSFSAEMTGKEIIKLARHPGVNWISADAPMISTSLPGMETIRDEFNSDSYDGNDGTQTWSTPWVESGESTNASEGLIQLAKNNYCEQGSCLRLDPYKPTGTYIYRQADLSGYVSVNLTLWRNNNLNYNSGSSEVVKLEISANGGASWTTLRTYTSKYYTGIGTDTFDISAYASSNMQIRFLISSYQSGSRYIQFDNIEISFARPSAFLPTVKADQLSLNGQGVTVAVVDSGIAYSNDFKIVGTSKSRIMASEYFTDSGGSEDLYGHGTSVAGILAGNGSLSNGTYTGIAPGVNLINLKVCDKYGMTYESDVIESLQWIYNNKAAYNIRAVNISMNSTVAQSYHTSPLDAAVEILWFNSIVVVVSAGNNGTGDGPSTLYAPANDPFVITVGATEDKGTSNLGDDNLAVFSAYGNTEDGFAKPDLVAPGRNLISPLADKASTIYNEHPLHRVGDYYIRISGTSLSAPIVSGAVAILLQAEPNLNPDQVKYRLMTTANQGWQGYSTSQSGAGYLDVYTAVNKPTSGSANQGIIPSYLLSNSVDATVITSLGWNSIGWNSIGWNSIGWNSIGWNSIGWNSIGWNSIGWNSIGWNSGVWDD